MRAKDRYNKFDELRLGFDTLLLSSWMTTKMTTCGVIVYQYIYHHINLHT